MRKRLIIILSIILVVVLITIGIAFFNTPFLKQEEGKKWVSIEPVQCRGNPWQQGESYLRDQEESFIKSYYAEQDIAVFFVKSKQVTDTVCFACDCRRGDILYLLVFDKDVNKMLDMHYKLVD